MEEKENDNIKLDSKVMKKSWNILNSEWLSIGLFIFVFVYIFTLNGPSQEFKFTMYIMMLIATQLYLINNNLGRILKK